MVVVEELLLATKAALTVLPVLSLDAAEEVDDPDEDDFALHFLRAKEFLRPCAWAGA